MTHLKTCCDFLNIEFPDPPNKQVSKNTQSYSRLADKCRFRKAVWPRGADSNQGTERSGI